MCSASPFLSCCLEYRCGGSSWDHATTLRKGKLTLRLAGLEKRNLGHYDLVKLPDQPYTATSKLLLQGEK